MRWHSISRSRLAMLTAIAIGALARDAAAQQSIGEFTSQGDVGRVTRPGSATYDSTTGVYQLAGSGANIWAARDAFHYAWRKMKRPRALPRRSEQRSPPDSPSAIPAIACNRATRWTCSSATLRNSISRQRFSRTDSSRRRLPAACGWAA